MAISVFRLGFCYVTTIHLMKCSAIIAFKTYKSRIFTKYKYHVQLI